MEMVNVSNNIEKTTKDGIKSLENIIKKNPIVFFIGVGVIIFFIFNKKDEKKKEVIVGSLPQLQDFGNIGSGGGSLDIPSSSENIDSDNSKILGITELRNIIQNQIDKNIKTQHEETVIDTTNLQNDDFETQLFVESEKRNKNFIDGIVPRMFNDHSKVSPTTMKLMKSATDEQKNIINRAYKKLNQRMKETGKSVTELVGRNPLNYDKIRKSDEEFTKIPSHTERKVVKQKDGSTKVIVPRRLSLRERRSIQMQERIQKKNEYEKPVEGDEID